MIDTVRNYVRDTAVAFGAAWNDFWLRPSCPSVLAGLRIATGVLIISWLLSFAPDLVTLFSADGLLTIENVDAWEQTVFAELHPFADANRRGLPLSARMSVLAICDSPAELWTALAASLAAALLFTLGVSTRVTSVLTLVAFLSFVNRAPLLAGPFEAVAAMLLFYLALGPSGAAGSFDRWRTLRKTPPHEHDQHATLWRAPPRWSATVSLRLIQVHLCAIYVQMALAQWGGGGGESPWATGEAIWLVAARPSAGWNFAWLADAPILVDFWTHGFWLFELAFPVVAWIPRARPLVLCLAAVTWLSFAALSGMWGFCLLIMVASCAFWPDKARTTQV